MRVLFLSQIVPYPPHGGVLQRGYNLIRELGRSASVHLLAFVHPDVLPTPAARQESQSALEQFCETVEYFPLWAKASRIHGIAALARSACSRQPFSVIAHRSPAFRERVTAVMRARPFDIVHADTLALGQFVPTDGAVPAVVTHHNIESVLMARRAKSESNILARRFLGREARKLAHLEASASSRFAVNIVMSTLDATTLAGLAPGVRTAVVPNGVDVDYFSPDDSDESPLLVYVGGMNMFANRDAVLHFLRAIWPLVRAAHPDVRFVAVGQDPPAELLEIIDRDPRVSASGYVADIRPLVRQAAVYVVPLRVGGGTRLKVLDGMAMGKAMVSTSIGCEGIDARPGEHIVVADDPRDFANAVLGLLADRARRNQLGRAARAFVEQRYAWRVVGDSLLGAYHEATSIGGAIR